MAVQTVPDTAIIVVAEGVLASRFGDEVVILNLKDGVYYGLESAGTRIWEMLQTPVTLTTIFNTIEAEYDVGATRCQVDVRALLNELAATGLIEIQERA